MPPCWWKVVCSRWGLVGIILRASCYSKVQAITQKYNSAHHISSGWWESLLKWNLISIEIDGSNFGYEGGDWIVKSSYQNINRLNMKPS